MQVKNKALVWLNTITLAIMLFVNYGSNTGLFSETTVGDISHKYDTLFAPAGYAFIIWSVIFIGCILFVIYQSKLLSQGDPRGYIAKTGIWFIVSNLLNMLWVFAWLSEMIGLSVVLILLLLATLSILTVRLRLEMDDEPVRTIFFIWWPLAFYLGWIMVASVACISAWLISLGWHGGSLSEPVWTMIMIAIAGLLYIYLIQKRNLRESALVGVWAFIAIAVRQWESHKDIAWTAIIASAILLLLTSIHGYRNRLYAPNAKIKRGEWK